MGSGGLRQPGGILARNRDLPRRQASTLFGAVAIRVRGASRSWIQSPDVSASGPVRRRRTACGRASSVYGCLEVRTPGHLLPRIEAWNARGLGTLEVLERSRSWPARDLGPLGVLARSGCFVGARSTGFCRIRSRASPRSPSYRRCPGPTRLQSAMTMSALRQRIRRPCCLPPRASS